MIEDVFSAFWNGFTAVPIMLYDSFKIVLDFIVSLPSIFTDIIAFLPYPLSEITVGFLPLIITVISFKVIKE